MHRVLIVGHTKGCVLILNLNLSIHYIKLNKHNKMRAVRSYLRLYKNLMLLAHVLRNIEDDLKKLKNISKRDKIRAYIFLYNS